MATEADYRLPRTVIPERYALRLEPNLEDASFLGDVTIDVAVTDPTDTIVLNAVELEISAATIEFEGATHTPTWSLDAETQRLSLHSSEPIGPGSARVSISFRGILNDRLRGFYRSTYTDDDAVEHVIATTQFEATDARRAFPCWDEPDLKAVFGVTLVVDDGLLALSNAAEIARTDIGGGKVEVRFAPTVTMSTYLVAFIVGNLEATDPVDVDGTNLRIITPPGKLHLTDFALEAGAHALRFFADYYDVPYPGDKLDMVAIPDFAWGAMENLGCITYRETALLVDDATATQVERMRVASVIAHEIAHMWFGDLVTMKWWNGIWLNEAFATFAENKATDAFRPEWKQWLAFSADRARSQETDALATTRPIEIPVASPQEADAMFDVLTYEKGSSVLRMMEQYLGEETFRAGVSHYLKTHAFGNTDNEDLWASLEAVSSEPVGSIMDTWIFQGGFPVVAVEATDDGSVTIRQRQFRYLGEGNTVWEVPVRYRSEEGEDKVLLGSEPERLVAGDQLVVNAGGEGFYRVDYDKELGASITGRLEELDPIERFSVVSDRFANVLAGTVDAADYIELVGGMSSETENDVWSIALAAMSELDRVVSSDDRPVLQAFVRDLLEERTDELGWSTQPGESDRTRALRGQLLRARGILGNDRDTIGHARTIEAGTGDVDAEVADAALMVAAAHGTLDDFERYLAASEAAATPQLTVKYLRAATMVPDPAVPERMIRMIIDRDIRSQDSFWVLALLIGNRETGARAWQLLTEHWDEVLTVVPPTNAYRMLDLLHLRSEPDTAASIRSWFEDHEIPGSETKISQRLEQLEVRTRLRDREGDRLGRAFPSASSP